METLLKSNRRIATLLVALAALPCALGLGLGWWSYAGRRWGVAVLAATLAAVSGYQLIRQLLWWARPRLALTADELLVFLERPRPTRVPLDAVECFFIGQAASQVRVTDTDGRRVENVTVVVRLAERATTWHQRPTHPALGRWSDGYITIAGAWCEPLDGEKVQHLNQRLSAAKRARRQGVT